jgi:hypothetical protein
MSVTPHDTTAGTPIADDGSRRLRRRLRPLYLAAVLQGFTLWVPVEKLFLSEIGFDAATELLSRWRRPAGDPRGRELGGNRLIGRSGRESSRQVRRIPPR